MSKTMQNSNQTRKQQLLKSISKSQKAFESLTLIVIGPILAQFNPIQPKQLPDMQEGARIQFRPKTKLAKLNKVTSKIF